MGTAYYYFVASLPRLAFAEKAAYSFEQFCGDCQRLLSGRDFKTIQDFLQSEEPSIKAFTNSFLQTINQFDIDFRNEAAWFQAEAMNKDPLGYLRGPRNSNPKVIDALAEASESLDPLEAEKILDRARWQYFDELLQGHYFDFECLVVYGLKLKILERYKMVDSEAGGEIFAEYKKEILAAIGQNN